MIKYMRYAIVTHILYQGAAMDVGQVLEKLRGVRIFKVCELAAWLACSVPTARRRLREWKAHTSINCNGCYYALPAVPRFDGNGLWRCDEAAFSRHGNLRQTVCFLVWAAPAGLTSGELGGILGMEARSFLSHFRREPRVCQIREGRRDVWLSSDPAVRERQMLARRHGIPPEGELPSAAEAVLVLVEVIRQPDDDAESIAHRLEARGTPVAATRIRRLLELHGLAKKGAPDSARSGL